MSVHMARPILLAALAAVLGIHSLTTAQGDLLSIRFRHDRLRSLAEQDPIGLRKFLLLQLDRTGPREIVHLAGPLLEVFFNPTRHETDLRVRRLRVDANPRGLVAGDFDGDRNVDLAILSFDTARITILYGDGHATFPRRTHLPTGAEPQSLVAADFNGDAHVDLAFTARHDEARHAVNILINRGNGEFDGGSHVVVGAIPFGLAAADLDGDGSRDLAVANAGSDSVHVLLNNRAGHFSIVRRYAVGSGPWDIATGDLNEDGLVDLVTTNALARTVSVLLGRAGGTFRAGRPVAAEALSLRRLAAQTLALGDLDGDGHLDVMLSNGSGLRGRGDGSLAQATEFAMSAGALVLRDLDGDGRTEAVFDNDFTSAPHVTVAWNGTLTTNRPPVARPLDAIWDFGDVALIDGRASSDPDGHLLAYEWRDELGRVVGDTPVLTVRRLPGEYTYSLTVRDPYGHESISTATLTVVGEAPPHADIVLHATDATTVRGTWRRVDDPTAASGVRLHQPNAGAAKVAAPAARPASYFDLRFRANPALVYRLWIRARADGNAWQNDSVFVQFSGAVGPDGERQWRTGSTSALRYRLERCASCGLDGWGWNTDGFTELSNVGTPLQFSDDEWQTIRIQQREDGVSIDQIVLSSVTYLGTLSPGADKRDAIVLSKTP
jgi:hypothetical protein